MTLASIWRCGYVSGGRVRLAAVHSAAARRIDDRGRRSALRVRDPRNSRHHRALRAVQGWSCVPPRTRAASVLPALRVRTCRGAVCPRHLELRRAAQHATMTERLDITAAELVADPSLIGDVTPDRVPVLLAQ